MRQSFPRWPCRSCLPTRPTYIQAIEQHRYFQITSLGREDLQRAEYYRANAERQEMLNGSENVEEFLASLANGRPASLRWTKCRWSGRCN